MAIDLHIHTNASDGNYSPKEVVQMAKKAGLLAIAITDHDTIAGLSEALEWGKKLEIEIVPGIELNTDYQNREVHLLGYYPNWTDLGFQSTLKELQSARITRAKRMIEKLNQIGVMIDYQTVQAIAGQGAIGRPHLARAIIEAGYAANWNEIFERYLGKDCFAYVPRTKLTPFSAVELILQVGGIPILAHPGLNDIDQIIPDLLAVGLKGLEVYHYEHTAEDQKRYLKITQKNDLLVTGGSDFHGPTTRANVKLGDCKLPLELLRKLQEARIN